MTAFGQPFKPLVFPEPPKVISKSYLPRFAQKKRIKRPVVDMCKWCGEEFFTKKEKKGHNHEQIL